MQATAAKHLLFPLRQYTSGRRDLAKVLAESERTQWRSAAQIGELQLAKLVSLVEYSYERVPYYRTTLDEAGVTPGDIRSLDDIRRLPVLRKADVRENLSSMVAAGFRGRLNRNATSGSTGHPLVLVEDGTKHTDTMVEYVRFLRWFGVDVGAREVRLIQSSSETRQFSLRILAARLLLNRLLLPGLVLSEQTFEDSYAKMARFRPRVVFGYTAALHEFARYVLAKEKNLSGIRPDIVIAWASPLHPHERQLMESAFDCPVASLYGTKEVGHIAGECPEGSFHINDEMLLVEAVDSGVPCGPGEKGSILVTTLNHYAMPFIRYDIGDAVILDDTPCSCGRGLSVLKEIVGREGEILTTPSGRVLPPNYWYHVMHGGNVAGHVRQFQVVQRTKADVAIRIVREEAYTDEDTRFLENSLTSDLGDDLRILFEFVDDIPPERTGKYRIVASEV